MAPNCPPPRAIGLSDLQPYHVDVKAAEIPSSKVEQYIPQADDEGRPCDANVFKNKTSASSSGFLSNGSGNSDFMSVHEMDISVPETQSCRFREIGCQFMGLGDKPQLDLHLDNGVSEGLDTSHKKQKPKLDKHKSTSSSGIFSDISGNSDPCSGDGSNHEQDRHVTFTKTFSAVSYTSANLEETGAKVENVGSVLEQSVSVLHEKMDYIIEQLDSNLRFTKAVYKKTKKGLTEPTTEGIGFLRRNGSVNKEVSREFSFKSRWSVKDVAEGSGGVSSFYRSDSRGEHKQSPSSPQGNKKKPVTSNMSGKDSDGMAMNLLTSMRNSKPGATIKKTASRHTLAGHEKEHITLMELSHHMTELRNSTFRKSGRVWRFFEDRSSSTFALRYYQARNVVLVISVLFAWMQVVEMGGTEVIQDRLRVMSLVTPIQIAIESWFFAEIFIRFLVCQHKGLFCINLYNLIDFVSALPLTMRVAILVLERHGRDLSTSVEVYALFGLVPVLRLLKLLRRFEQFQLLLTSFKGALQALPVMIFTMLLIVLSFAAMIYYFEPRDNIPTLVTSVYFVMVTIGTVGYGDYSPKSLGGRMCSLLLIVVGSLYMAIPIGIVGYSFSQVWEDRHRLLLMQRMRNRIANAGYAPQDLKVLFGYLDKNDSGSLDYDEFRSMIDILEIEVEERFIEQVFECFDDNDENTISFQEFIRGLFPNSKWVLDAQALTLNEQDRATYSSQAFEGRSAYFCEADEDKSELEDLRLAAGCSHSTLGL